jgi:hypothetical protein
MARLAHRRISNDGQTTAWLAKSVGKYPPAKPGALDLEPEPGGLFCLARLPPGTSPYKAFTVSFSVANGAEASPEAFDAPLPPRYLVFGERKVWCHIPKLDSSAPHFIQSRTLARCARAIAATDEPTKREILTNVRNLWMALEGGRHTGRGRTRPERRFSPIAQVRGMPEG